MERKMEFSGFFCFRMGAISRKMARSYNSKLDLYGITMAQSWVLLHLAGSDGSSVKEIAGALQLDSPVVSGLVDRLSKEALVERRTDPTDRRSVRVFLTPEGTRLINNISEALAEYNQRIRSIVPDGDLDAFERALIALEKDL